MSIFVSLGVGVFLVIGMAFLFQVRSRWNRWSNLGLGLLFIVVAAALLLLLLGLTPLGPIGW